jgi:hypothetical protein
MPDTSPAPVDLDALMTKYARCWPETEDVYRDILRLIREVRELRSARAAIPGPDSERIRELEAENERLSVERDDARIYARDALRAAGLLPGPDTITVNREALRLLHECTTSEAWRWAYGCAMNATSPTTYGLDAIGKFAKEVLAALSEPPAPKETQP